MTTTCQTVAERVALGEPLAELAEHVADCTSCQQLVAMTGKLGAARHAVDPGLGFSARMTVGAQHRLVVRRRRRIAGSLAAITAASVLGVFVVTRSPVDANKNSQAGVDDPHPTNETPVALDEGELKSLVQLADTQHAARASAPWKKIQRPLAPYKKLVKGVR
jgi:hypothetical protein